MPGGGPPGPPPASTIAARDAPTVEGGVVVDLADVDCDIAGEVLDAPATGVRRGVVVDLAEVEGELAGGAGRPMRFPVAMPPPEGPPAKLSDTRLKLSVALPWAFTMPPPLPSKLPVPGLLLFVTTLPLRVSVAAIEPKVPLAIPPPAVTAELPVTTLWLSVTVPLELKIAPPKSEADPPVRVMLRSDRLPPGPSTSKMRTAPDPVMVAPLPNTEIGVITTGKPFSP